MVRLEVQPEDGSLLCLENGQQSECYGGTDVEARPIDFGLYFCFSTEAWKKETREDSEWGALPGCDQPQPVPPSRKLHWLHRLGHGPLHQEVQTVYLAVCRIYSSFHCHISTKYTDRASIGSNQNFSLSPTESTIRPLISCVNHLKHI